MKKGTIPNFASVLFYCLKLSLQASRFNTFTRLFGNIIIPLFSILSSFVLKQLINILAAPQAVEHAEFSVAVYFGIMLMLAILSAGARKCVEYSESQLNSLVGEKLKLDIMGKAISADLEMFDNTKLYDRFAKVSNDATVISYCLWSALDVVSAFITFIGVFFVLANYNVWYAVILTLSAIPAAIARNSYVKKLYQMDVEQINMLRKNEYVFGLATDKAYAQDIRLYHLGDILKHRFEELWMIMYLKKKKLLKRNSLFTALLEFLPELAVTGSSFDIARQVLRGKISIGDYTFASGMLSQLWGSILILIINLSKIWDNKLKIDNVKSFEALESHVLDKGKVTLKKIDSIDFNQVDFIYPGTDKLILNQISFHIGKNEKIALVGINGAGKSTIIKLLLRFYDVNAGSIAINGLDIRQYTLASLHSSFSTYFQNMPNYGFTVRENTALSSWERKDQDEEIEKALKQSGASEVIKKHCADLQTYITRWFDEDGIELSGGEQQKMALARVFFRTANVIILDEPSSSLDPEAESKLFEKLKELCENRMALFTSHRLSNVHLADRIFVIENGTLVEQGAKEELLKQGGRFSELYHYQSEKFQ